MAEILQPLNRMPLSLRSAALLTPAPNSLIEEVNVRRVRLPRFGKFGALASGAAVGRQIGETDTHRQGDALSEGNRLLGTQAGQRREHPACRIGQCGLHKALI